VNFLPQSDFGRAIAFSLVNPLVAYAGFDEGVLRSDDGGRTWTEADAGLPPGTGVYSMAIDPVDPDIAYASNRFARPDEGVPVYRTVDGGASWIAMSAGLPTFTVLNLATDPAAPGMAFVSIQDRGLFDTKDGGTSWHEADRGLVNTSVVSLLPDPRSAPAIFAGTTAGLFRSPDSGRTWATLGGRLSGVEVDSLAANPARAGELFAATGDGVVRSGDDGRTWSATALALGSTEVAVGAGLPATVYASSGGGYEGSVYRTTDSGRSWTRVFDHSATIAVNPADPNTVLIGSGYDGEIYRSTDGGVTWDEVASLSTNQIVFDPLHPATVYAALQCATGCQEGSGVKGVWKSLDGGLSWSAADVGLPEDISVQAVAVDPSDDGMLYAGTDGFGVYRSTDSGATWTALGPGLETAFITALAVSPSGAVVHAGTRGSGAFEYVVSTKGRA
jgi:photosystem II stability/assembly factor-like uncharacterized protein